MRDIIEYSFYRPCGCIQLQTRNYTAGAILKYIDMSTWESTWDFTTGAVSYSVPDSVKEYMNERISNE